MPILSLMFGAIVGLSLGLTGGGGAIFAVPLLVYGLSIDPRQAVGISLVAVGMTALVGFFGRWKAGQVEVATGLMFAIAGMIGCADWLVAVNSDSRVRPADTVRAANACGGRSHVAQGGLVERRCDFYVGRRRRADLPSRRGGRTPSDFALSPFFWAVVGVLTGVLSGLFGVGGGFVIVPALVLFSGMAIHRAVGTSLLVITLVSASGVASHLWAGRDIPIETTLYFIVGGVLGMFAGIWASRYLSGPALQKVFAVAIVAVAIFVILRTTNYF